MQSCVENFRVDDAMILKVRDTVTVTRRKLLPRGFALMTPRVVVPAACALLLPAQMIAAWLSAYDAARGGARRLAACANASHVRAAVCELRTFALASCARAGRSRSPSRYVVRAAGEAPPKTTLSASSATRLRHGCSCLRGALHNSTPRALSSFWTTRATPCHSSRGCCATSSSPLPLQSTSPPQLATCAPTASRGLAQLDANDVVVLDNEADTVSFHTRLLRRFVEFHGRTYHCHPDAVDLAIGACDLCSDCVRVGRPTLGHALDRHQERRPPVRLVQTNHLLGRQAVQVDSLNAVLSRHVHALATRPDLLQQSCVVLHPPFF